LLDHGIPNCELDDKGAEHLVSVEFALVLWGTPLESWCDWVTKWWKNSLRVGTDKGNAHSQLGVEPQGGCFKVEKQHGTLKGGFGGVEVRSLVG